MNNVHKLVDFANGQLAPILGVSGNVLYSAAQTLRPGKIYLLGLNPGGDPEKIRQTVGESLRMLDGRTRNAYLDEEWRWRGKLVPKGESPLQKRINWLLTSLGSRVENVCASNLIFIRSASDSGCGFPGMADLCWPVHQEIMSMVKPKLILCFGNSRISPYSYVRNKISISKETTFPSGHGRWKCRAFQSSVGAKVVGLPHLSRYSISSHPEVLDYISDE